MARIMVAIGAWVAVNRNNTTPITNFWVECTGDGTAGSGGSAYMATYLAAYQATLPAGDKAAITQYHVYFADGGHARYTPASFKIQETNLGPADPSLAPSPLVPTPEW